jgi:hypothetical protein
VQSNAVHNLYRLGIYVDAEADTLTNIEVSANVVHDCMYGIVTASEAGGLLQDIRVVNNVVFANRYIGIEIAEIGANGPQRDIAIGNNTIVSNGYAGAWGGAIAVSSHNAANRNFTIRNNLCSGNLDWEIGAVTSMLQHLTASHNLCEEFRGYGDEDFVEIIGSSFVTGVPRFVSTAAANYRILPGSPAIDRGTPTGAPPLDFDGRARPLDGDANGTAAVDIGAFEFTPPRIALIALTGGTARIAWESVSGATYRVQFSPAVLNPVWTNIAPDVTAAGDTAEGQDPLAAGATQRFYRIHALGE